VISVCCGAFVNFFSSLLRALIVSAATASGDFAALLGAGVREEADKHPDKHQTVGRSVQKLAASLAPLSPATDATEAKLQGLGAVHTACQHERRAADVPYVSLPVAPAKVDPRANRLTALVLDTLSSFIRAAERMPQGEGEEDAGAAATACGELCEMLEGFAPGAMFEDWSPAPLPAERVLNAEVDAHAAFASLNGEDAAKPLAAGKQLEELVYGLPASVSADPDADGSGVLGGAGAVPTGPAVGSELWKGTASADATGTAVWGVAFDKPTPVSSLKLFWLVSCRCGLRVSGVLSALCCYPLIPGSGRRHPPPFTETSRVLVCGTMPMRRPLRHVVSIALPPIRRPLSSPPPLPCRAPPPRPSAWR